MNNRAVTAQIRYKGISGLTPTIQYSQDEGPLQTLDTGATTEVAGAYFTTTLSSQIMDCNTLTGVITFPGYQPFTFTITMDALPPSIKQSADSVAGVTPSARRSFGVDPGLVYEIAQSTDFIKRGANKWLTSRPQQKSPHTI